MLEQSTRRHPVQTFQFWFIVLCSFAVVTAWKLDLFVISSPAKTDAVAIREEPMPPPPREKVKRTADLERAVVNTVPAAPLAEQTEAAQVESVQAQQVVKSPASSPVVAHVAARPSGGIELASYDESALSQAEVSSSGVVHAMGQVETPEAEQQIARTAYVRQIPRQHELSAPESSARRDQNPVPVGQVNLTELDQLLATGQDVAALRLCSRWYWNSPEQRPQFQKALNALAARVYFQSEPYYLPPHVVQFGETLESIAARYQVTPQYLKRVNRVEPVQMRVGQSLKVLQGPFSAVIDLSDRDLTVHAQGYYLARFRVGFGDFMQLPPGRYHIADKAVAPVNQAENPNDSGMSRWLILGNETGSTTQQGIHGTDDDSLIGQVGGAGCIRMSNRELDALFDLLMSGAEVVVRP